VIHVLVSKIKIKKLTLKKTTQHSALQLHLSVVPPELFFVNEAIDFGGFEDYIDFQVFYV